MQARAKLAAMNGFVMRVSFLLRLDYRPDATIGKLRRADLAWLVGILFPKRHRSAQAAHTIFNAIVQQSRRPQLYAEAGLPDTLEGRFYAIVVYSALIFPRLENAGASGRGISRYLNKRIFDSFDSALRETGVGDASIARKVRKMGEAFAGIGTAVHSALREAEPVESLSSVLERNEIVSRPASHRLAEILVIDAASLSGIADSDLLTGQTGWCE